ncbi:hypothetical protein BDV38DRAFT_234705 [Aspergillus pseudotamarii]|uniref:Uncharacterized protein n=1 Tax=Aspergillus pseudotamarii TaxID=132259 RepID=A0A5N6T880_ASPPS|nr:uncharacterized protein BDV38DRAFT_234705 [Aspergillus pseudotamarii]KAE8142391.1 hypothetical protein BDV38DRAFT_234705 [Aspergillus pseudotamarii]
MSPSMFKGSYHCRLLLSLPSALLRNCPTHLDPITATHVAKQIPYHPLHSPSLSPIWRHIISLSIPSLTDQWLKR